MQQQQQQHTNKHVPRKKMKSANAHENDKLEMFIVGKAFFALVRISLLLLLSLLFLSLFFFLFIYRKF